MYLLKGDLSNSPSETFPINYESEIHKVFSDIKKVRRSNEKIQFELGRRTIQEVIDSGETCYMWSCVDMTLALLVKLKDQHPAPEQLTLWCELLFWKANKIPSFHFFIQDNLTQPATIIDFEKNNRVCVYKGVYHNAREGNELEQLWLFSLSADQISLDSSLFTIIQKMGLPFQESDFTAYLQKLEKDNTPEEFERFMRESSAIEIMSNIKSETSLSQEKIQSELIDTIQGDPKN